MHEASFHLMKKVPIEWLQERISSVKELRQNELEMYEVAKDNVTGEHYLHYSYLHRNVAGTLEPEVYHQLLPLKSDDVLGLIFGEQAYLYPESWNEPFLRDGPEGFFIWFDPDNDEERLQNEAFGASLTEKLLKFKAAGSLDEAAVRKLLEELDHNDN
ncbi:hypothetical protein [Paenibacillus eucommiae]|uniref:SMI1/KNR4 family protein n=1 Tax=Paenibacillus eucommiae TaxID=1355755 RepID=A0ABS4J610_9BACL|nr:hypothetical protein [Paenibacillus eucommiae]MBP1995262.1 hypothetical protein [Paenibacillus eucommiae]